MVIATIDQLPLNVAEAIRLLTFGAERIRDCIYEMLHSASWLDISQRARLALSELEMNKKRFRNQKLGKQTTRRQTLAKWKAKIDRYPHKRRTQERA
jgi:hypothetical protein